MKTNQLNRQMTRLTDYMTESFAPWANRVTGNVWVKSLQEAIMSVVPMILVGSLVTLVSILNNYFSWMPNLTPINQFSFGLMGLIVAFVMPYQVMHHKGLENRRLVAGMTGLAVYLLLLAPKFSDDGSTLNFSFERFGAGGMFLAIITGLVVGVVFTVFARLKLFKSASLPDFLVVWFDSLLPILLCLVAAWLLVDTAGLDVYADVLKIFAPLVGITQSFWGFVLVYFLMGFTFSFGMSAWLVFNLVYPFMLEAIQANVAAVAAGHPAVYINTMETGIAWLLIGGVGCTLPLVLMMSFWAKSPRLRAIGKASLVPGILNINEPVVFGAPIALNPILMVPFWINSLVPPILTYGALASGIVAIPSKLFQLWYIPVPILTWLVQPGIMSLILFAVIAVFCTLVWLPFFRAYDRVAVAEDAAKASVPAASGGALEAVA